MLIAPDVSYGVLNVADDSSVPHAVEHFGLGWYSDPINYEGYIFGLNNMYNILKGGGKFYFSVPTQLRPTNRQ